MPGGLAGLFRDIQRATSERAVAVALMDHGPTTVGSHTTGFYSMLDEATVGEVHLRGMAERAADLYQAQGRDTDPLLKWVLEHHAANAMDVERFRSLSPSLREVHDEIWRLGGAPDLGYYMVAPIIVNAAVVGTMQFASAPQRRLHRFLGSAISLHVSTRIAVLRAVESFPTVWDGALTAREQEVASLAARGLSTRDMGRVAGISPNTVKKHLKHLYAKLGVTSRAELSSVLLHGPRWFDATQADRGLPQRKALRGVSAYFY